MSELLGDIAMASDAELIVAVRAGDTHAYGVLFERHRDAAMHLARQLVSGPDADDLVAESFIRVLTTLQNGKGPEEFFRAYLLTSIRRLHIDRIRAGQRVRTTDDEAELDRAVDFVDPAEMRFEQGAAATAFASLPERWQLVLWHLDVEGHKPADVAPLLGMTANSVSALAYRAREGLRQAYLQSHLAPSLHASCRTTTGMLGAYVRKGLSQRDVVKVETHLDDCSRCTGLYLELAEINGNLSGILGPALLGSVFTGYTAGTGTVGLKLVAAKLIIEPAKSVGTVVTGSGVQGIATAAVVTCVAAAGTIAAVTDFNSAGDRAPQMTEAAPAARITTPAKVAPDTAETPRPHAEPAAATPTLSPAPSATQPSEPIATTPTDPQSSPGPADQPDSEPSITPTPAPTPTSPPEPTPPPPISPTDYGIAASTITSDDTLLQRRFTTSITAANAGRAADQTVTVTMQFTRQVTFRGVVSAGWDCGPATRNQNLSSLSCSTTLPAGQGATFIVKAIGLRPSGSISVTATGDPRPDNNSVSFRSPIYQYPS